VTIDPELVTRKIVLVMRDLDALRPLAERERTAYLASGLDEAAAERYLERLIGRMIDINFHLITESGHPPPPDYHASFTRLAEIEVLDRTFATQITSCAGLRNRIIHEYDEIDPAKVFEALQTAIRDVPEYLRQVNEFLDRHREASAR
jgi:uncharacterized protein YutE (UPF0331/DUF86 family)